MKAFPFSRKWIIQWLGLDVMDIQIERIRKELNEFKEFKESIEHDEEIKTKCTAVNSTAPMILCKHGRFRCKSINLTEEKDDRSESKDEIVKLDDVRFYVG